MERTARRRRSRAGGASPKWGPSGRRRSAPLVLTAFWLIVAGCSEKRAVEVKGWPRAGALAKSRALDKAEPPVPPRRPKLADVEAWGERVDASQSTDTSRDQRGPEDAAGDTLEIRTWKGMTVCDRIVETACVYLGVHSQECAEFRGWRRLEATDETLSECQAILDQFDMTYNQPGLRRVRNPCWSLAYDICEQHGRTSEACQEARDEARRMRRPQLRRACKGGILLYEVKKAFPGWGPNALPRVVRP